MKSLILCQAVDDKTAVWWTIAENRLIDGDIYDGAEVVIHYEYVPYPCTIIQSSNSTKQLEKRAMEEFADDPRFTCRTKLVNLV